MTDNVLVNLANGLDTKIAIYESVEGAREDDARLCFNQHGIIAIEGHRWQSDIDSLYALKKNAHKPYQDKEMFKKYSISAEPPSAKPVFDSLEKEVAGVIETIFSIKIPECDKNLALASWRPFGVGPEPMHFDSFDDRGTPHLLAFVNIDKKPRIWRVSYTWPEFVRRFPEFIKDGEDLRNAVIRLRHLTHIDSGPISGDYPQHEVQFPPGSIWICDPKMVLHAIKRGGCVFMYRHGRAIPGGKTQKDYL